MKKSFLAILLFVLLLVACTSRVAIRTDEKTPGPTTILLENQLPPNIQGMVSVNTFGEIIANEQNRYPTVLTTRISGDQVLVKASLDIRGIDTDPICYSNILSLDLGERYIAYLNHWFFAKRSEWDENLAAAMSSYRYLYVVEFRCDNMILQIHGKIIKGAYGKQHIELQSPVYLQIPGWEEVHLAPIERDALGVHYIKLEPPYNPVTGEYYGSYLVYKFFNREDKLQNIPEPKFWNAMH